MRGKKTFFFIWALTSCISASPQCLSGDTLWKRIDWLAGNSKPGDVQLQKLQELQDLSSRCKTTPDTADAYLLHRIGVMYFFKSDHQSAVKYTLKSLDILRDLEKNQVVNPKQKLRSYRNLNIYYKDLGWSDKYSVTTDSCIAICFSSNLVDSFLLYSICDKIVTLMNTGDYSRCLQYALLSQNLADKYGYENSIIIKRIFSWKINALLLLKDYTSVQAELKNKIEQYKRAGNDDYTGNLYSLWASYYLGTGKIDSAILSLHNGYIFCLKSKFKEGCASSLNGSGFIYAEYLKNYPKALDNYFRALSFADPKESVSIFNNIGNVFLKRNLFDSAFSYYQKAFDQIHPGANEVRLLNSPDYSSLNNLAEYLVTLVLDKADAYLYWFRMSHNSVVLQHALSAYQTADLLMDKIKQSQFEFQSKVFWRKGIRRLYEHAIEASWLAKNTDQGLYFFEKSRAVLLDDQMKQGQLMGDREIIQQYQLKKTISRLENELDTINVHSDQYAQIQSEIIGKKEEQDRLLKKINEKDPIYFARNVGSANLAELKRNVLKNHSALLEIFNGDSSMFILTVTKEGSSLTKINKMAYDSLSGKFISLISNPVTLNRQFESFVDISRNLYKLIFPTATLPKGRIIISPDGVYFPFEALITGKEGSIRYLVEDFSISYTYSARFLMNPFPVNPNSHSHDFMGMAPVDYAANLNLASLSGSDSSLHTIQAYFSKPYTTISSAATKRNFLSNFTNYRILQIYSHASYNDAGGKPVIYFSDSALDLSELYSQQRPAARLVVLSACETALGREYKGEGIFSFSREFAALGIPASVSNLWSVDNESTYRITELFYQFISEGFDTDEALRLAKLKFIQGSSRGERLPYYWASPILIGKTEILRTKSPFPYWPVVLLAGFAISMILLRYVKKNSHKNISGSVS